MTKDVETVARTMAAKREATAAGKDWKNLTPEKKQEAKKGATGTEDDRERAFRWMGRRMATAAGVDWNTASREQRQSFVRQARAANKTP